jgi:hypothetical protein
MNCATCKSDIDNDSFYCDQCGKELFICPVCGKCGKGKNCVEDGGKLFSPKQKSATDLQSEIQNQNSSSVSSPLSKQEVAKPGENYLKSQQPFPLTNLSIPVLKLVNHREKIDIEIKDGGIIGNSNGEHVNIFRQYNQVSGIHAKFVYDKDNGWMVIDIGSTGNGSTNGTAISNSPDWKNVPKLLPNVPGSLKNNTLLLIANIEFQVKIILPQQPTPTGTQRL